MGKEASDTGVRICRLADNDAGKDMDWDDFRYFSALARTGSVRGAAGQLGVNPSTVTRRLDALEEDLGVLLFTRSPKGMQITPEGAEVVQKVEGVGEQLREIESSLKGRDQRLEGRIRVALPDVLAVNFLLADLASFTQNYPGIDLVFGPGYHHLGLHEGQTDVAIRATESPPEDMVGRPLGRIALAAYGSRYYVAQHKVLMDLHGAAWIEWARRGEMMSLYSSLRQKYFSGVHVQVRCDQVFMQHACIRAHMGLGVLPCLLGEQDETLMRLPHMPVLEGPALWLLTHPDLRGARRIVTFMDFVRDIFVQRKHELIGAYL